MQDLNLRSLILCFELSLLVLGDRPVRVVMAKGLNGQNGHKKKLETQLWNIADSLRGKMNADKLTIDLRHKQHIQRLIHAIAFL